MTCARWRRPIALHASGDLNPIDAHRVEMHLESCPSCRELAEGLAADRETLARLEARTSENLDLRSIRGAVLGRLAGHERRPWLASSRGLGWAAVVAAAVAVLAVSVLDGPRVGPDRPPTTERRVDDSRPAVDVIPRTEARTGPETGTSSTPSPASELSTPAEEAPMWTARGASPSPPLPAAAAPPASAEPMTIKVLTDDPGVVIFWIVGEKGEKKHA